MSENYRAKLYSGNFELKNQVRDSLDKLIIKCVICNFAKKGVEACWRMTPEQTAKEAKSAMEAGAAVVHFHEPWIGGKPGGLAAWQEGAKLIREICGDVVIEHGRGGKPYSIGSSGGGPINAVRDPKNDLRIEHKLGTDMVVVSLGMIDHGIDTSEGMAGREGWEGAKIFSDDSMDHRVQSTTRRELEENVRYYRECGVKPRLETFGTPGPFRNLEWLVSRGDLNPPYCLTWNFGMNGIVGDPATPEYLRQRIAAMPPKLKDDINAEISVYQPGASRLLLHAMAIAEGFHVRVGMEDVPYYWDNIPAKGNAELVARVVRLAKEFHREVADPSEARKMYKL